MKELQAAAVGEKEGYTPKSDGREAAEKMQQDREEREDKGGTDEGFFVFDLTNMNLWL